MHQVFHTRHVIVVISNEESLEITLVFVAKLGCSSINLSIQFKYNIQGQIWSLGSQRANLKNSHLYFLITPQLTLVEQQQTKTSFSGCKFGKKVFTQVDRYIFISFSFYIGTFIYSDIAAIQYSANQRKKFTHLFFEVRI